MPQTYSEWVKFLFESAVVMSMTGASKSTPTVSPAGELFPVTVNETQPAASWVTEDGLTCTVDGDAANAGPVKAT
jgi:hypothetical protein